LFADPPDINLLLLVDLALIYSCCFTIVSPIKQCAIC